MRPISEILVDSLNSFEGGKRWCRGTLFLNKHRQSTISTQRKFSNQVKDAESFCAYGAILKNMHEHGELNENPFANETASGKKLVNSIEHLLAGATVHNRRVVMTNDQARDFSTVKDMFCTGIKRALEEETNNDSDD